jgi:hypothetical protein
MTNNPLVDKLLSSFGDLERSISITKQSLSQKEGVPQDVLSRLDQYLEMVLKQKSIADELREQIAAGSWEHVARNVKIINGISAMIREDAQQILASASFAAAGLNTPPKDDRLLS